MFCSPGPILGQNNEVRQPPPVPDFDSLPHETTTSSLDLADSLQLRILLRPQLAADRLGRHPG